MAKLILVGGDKVNVSQDKADSIRKMKWGEVDSNGDTIKEPEDKDHVIDIRGYGFFELRDIRRIVDDFSSEGNEQLKSAQEKRLIETQKWEKEQKEWIGRTPEEKAERMVRSGCLLRYAVKMNKLPMPSALIEALLPRLISYFTENPTETWAMAKVYDDIIPQGEIKIKTSVGNFKSLGQAMTEPRNPNQMVNVICDQCGVKFQLEEAVAQFPTEERFCARCSSEQKNPEKNPVQTEVNLGL